MSNPPYQKNIFSKGSNNNKALSIYPHFYVFGTRCSSKTIMIFPDKWSSLPTGGDMRKASAVAMYELTSMITTYSVPTVFPSIASSFDLSICSAGLDCDFTVNGIVMDKPNAASRRNYSITNKPHKDS